MAGLPGGQSERRGAWWGNHGCQHELVCGGTQVTRWQGPPYAQRLLPCISLSLRYCIGQIAALRASARTPQSIALVPTLSQVWQQPYGSSPIAFNNIQTNLCRPHGRAGARNSDAGGHRGTVTVGVKSGIYKRFNGCAFVTMSVKTEQKTWLQKLGYSKSLKANTPSGHVHEAGHSGT